MKEKDLSCFGLVFTACSVFGSLLASVVRIFSLGSCTLQMKWGEESALGGNLLSGKCYRVRTVFEGL